MDTLLVLQLVLGVGGLVAWWAFRPGRCTGCGARQPVAGGAYCFACGRALSSPTAARPSAANAPAPTQGRVVIPRLGAAVLLYLAGVLALIVLIARSDAWSHGLALALVVFCIAGLVAVGVHVRRRQTCKACGANTFAGQVPKGGEPHCPRCGTCVRLDAESR